MVDRLVNSEANARRIATVENCFGANGQPLAIPGRVLVGEGVVTKMCRKKPKTRQFFLFNDILVYGNIVMDKKKYNKQHIIPLEEVKLENLEDDGILKNGWLIRTPTKSFAVYAATATEKTEWMAHINKCVEDLLKKTGKKPSLEHAAVWIPDAEASICMHCRKTQFTVLNRRHHCRKCGAVVCNPCSSKKFLLPAQSSKPLRVCLSCYDTLTKARANQDESTVSAKLNIPPSNQDSSGEDDSEDENDDGGKIGNLDKGLDNISIDEKPTFYGDTAEAPSDNSQQTPCSSDQPTSSDTCASNTCSDSVATCSDSAYDAGSCDTSTCDAGTSNE
ncbi:pleckstrin homology domain-containing family F member 2 [Caerostris darwini]|uniref:Pleckstrin homology domain-containing family F member 2 n=2 Tax=Caerostris TaxID=172845 RepID=A0AAV4MM79_9ARAC|nr:pleckstrin homology domain-containing family F member 2 [Caerostris darwini]GIY66703.1 pleckstrin homology domain-containing family F member 2 [Caerostris extrusa]